MTYEKIKEIVTNNPNITAEEFGEKLKENRINIKKQINIIILYLGILLIQRDLILQTTPMTVLYFYTLLNYSQS